MEAVAVERVQGRIADMPLNPKAPELRRYAQALTLFKGS